MRRKKPLSGEGQPSQGWSPATSEETGFSPHEITDFLQLEEEIEMELER